MINDYFYMFLHGILFKLTDEFADEKIYNVWFPNGKKIIYTITIIFTYIYFNGVNTNYYISFFIYEIWFIIVSILKLLKFDSICEICGDIDLSLTDPFMLLTIIKLPGFLYNFTYIVETKFIQLLYLNVFIIPAGILQYIEEYIKSINQNNYEEYKTVLRFSYLILIYLFNLLFVNNITLKLVLANFIGYIITSIISLIIQILHKEYQTSKRIDNKIREIKKNINFKLTLA